MYFELSDVIYLTVIAYLMGCMGGGAWEDFRSTYGKRYGIVFGLVTAGLVALQVLLMLKVDC